VGISPDEKHCDDRSTVPLDSYNFVPTQKYAFCVYPPPTGPQPSDFMNCDDMLHVTYPGGPAKSMLINFDATVSICLMKYRVFTAETSSETKINEEKFVIGEYKHKTGIVFMDSQTALSLDAACPDGEEFGFSLFGEEEDD
jgi:hypothetical protein